MKDQGKSSPLDWLELLEPEKSLSELRAAFSFAQGNMVSLILPIMSHFNQERNFFCFCLFN